MATTVVNTNYLSLIAQRNLAIHTGSLNTSLERLSTGLRVNRASDDSAGLTISQGLTSDIRAMQKALTNIQDGVSILEITEGTLSTIVSNLQRIRELTVQAANDTNARSQREAMELEIRTLITDLNRLTSAVKFNGINLLDGTVGTMLIHMGPESDVYENTVDITSILASADAQALGLLGGGTNAGFASIGDILLINTSMAHAFLRDVDNAINAISSRRALIGATQNQLEYTRENLQIRIQNFTQSNSVIRDLDVASEMSSLVRSQILQESSINILKQANQNDAGVLSLLQV